MSSDASSSSDSDSEERRRRKKEKKRKREKEEKKEKKEKKRRKQHEKKEKKHKKDRAVVLTSAEQIVAADAEVAEFLRSIRTGQPEAVQEALARCPDLLRTAVSCGTADEGKKMWSVVHEAVRCCPSAADGMSGTALAKRVEAASLDVLSALLEACKAQGLELQHLIGANDNLMAAETPLHQAAWSGSKAACQMLIDAGGDIFGTSPGGWLPIHYACDLRELLP